MSHWNTHTRAVIIAITRACLTATSQAAEELCWQEAAGGMGRSQVYDCADVNDIIQILNQAACLRSGSSPLAASLENLAWTPAVKLSNCCTPERSRQKVTAQICSGCLRAGSWASGRPHTRLFRISTEGGIWPGFILISVICLVDRCIRPRRMLTLLLLWLSPAALQGGLQVASLVWKRAAAAFKRQIIDDSGAIQYMSLFNSIQDVCAKRQR